MTKQGWRGPYQKLPLMVLAGSGQSSVQVQLALCSVLSSLRQRVTLTVLGMQKGGAEREWPSGGAEQGNWLGTVLMRQENWYLVSVSVLPRKSSGTQVKMAKPHASSGNEQQARRD